MGFVAVVLLATAARAERVEPTPKELQGVGIDEQLGARVATGAPFKDETGRDVTLASYLDGQTPVILTLNYSNCPMLCSLQLTGFVKGLRDVKWTAGRELRIVTVSLDPTEPVARAQASQKRYVGDYGRPEAAAGWHFLTGTDASIHAVASSVGFSYRYDPQTKEYAHVPAVVLLTPDGRVARYLYGVVYSPQTLRLSLLEAAEGKLTNTIDRVLLYCFHYDAAAGAYAPVARNIMRLSGGVVLALLVALLAVLWWREAQRRRARGAGS